MSTGGKRFKDNSIMSQNTGKMQSLIDDFKAFSKSFAKPKGDIKRRKKKPKVAVVPTYVKQTSNISEDSNDPKRRKNVMLSIDQRLVDKLNIKNPLPKLGQSINEEPFQSEDMTSSESNESEVKMNKEESKGEIAINKFNTSFFIHKRVKNNRQSILADRPLTIFKANTRKDSGSRFFSPQPNTPSKFTIKSPDVKVRLDFY